MSDDYQGPPPPNIVFNPRLLGERPNTHLTRGETLYFGCLFASTAGVVILAFLLYAAGVRF